VNISGSSSRIAMTYWMKPSDYC